MAKVGAKAPELKRWDQRPWPVRGDSNADLVFLGVGRALTAWERYEAMLGALFSTFIGNKDSNVLLATRAYFAVRTFEGRAEMLKAVSSAYFSQSDAKDDRQDSFKTIISDALKFAPRRNEIAHGVAVKFSKASSPMDPIEGQFALEPTLATYKSRTIENIPAYCYTSVELNYYAKEFIDLSLAAKELADAMT